MRRLAILAALLALLLTACFSRPDLSGLPELTLLTDDDGQEYLLVDGLRYNSIPFEIIGRHNPGRWTCCAERGRRVGMLGPDTICTAAGDEEEVFLYNLPETFRMGGVYCYNFLREDRSLSLPESGGAFDRGTVRTYASGGIFGKKAVVTCECTDEAVLTALFDCWNGTAETPPVPEGLDKDTRESRSIELWSREYPWLGFHISCSVWSDGSVTFLNREDTQIRLPDDVTARLTWEEPGLWQRLLG